MECVVNGSGAMAAIWVLSVPHSMFRQLLGVFDGIGRNSRRNLKSLAENDNYSLVLLLRNLLQAKRGMITIMSFTTEEFIASEAGNDNYHEFYY